MPFSDHHHHHHDGGPLSPPPSPPKPQPKLLSLLLKAIIMTIIITLFFLFLGVASILLLLATAALHRRHHHHHNHPTRLPLPSSGFSPKDLKRLPQFRFTPSSKKSSNLYQNQKESFNLYPNEMECVICLDGIRQGQWCRRLSGCGHVFHRRCVDVWLVKVSSCPVCRSRVGLDFGRLLGEEDRLPLGGGWFEE